MRGLILASITLSVMASGCGSTPSAADTAAAAADEAQRAKDEAENHRKGFHCLSPWDGSERDVVEKVKERLRDPDSFEHIDTQITPVNAHGYHELMMRYRSRNGFGGMTEGVATARVLNSRCVVIMTGMAG